MAWLDRWATNSASCWGGITQYSILRCVIPFFERLPHRLGTDRIDHLQHHQFLGQQLQRPASIPGGRCAQSTGHAGTDGSAGQSRQNRAADQGLAQRRRDRRIRRRVGREVGDGADDRTPGGTGLRACRRTHPEFRWRTRHPLQPSHTGFIPTRGQAGQHAHRPGPVRQGGRHARHSTVPVAGAFRWRDVARRAGPPSRRGRCGPAPNDPRNRGTTPSCPKTM